MTIVESLKNAINGAINDGLIDEIRQKPIIEAAYKVAAVMDDPDWPMVNQKIDNVSPSVFLKYCDALKLTVNDVEVKAKKQGNVNKTAQLVGHSKWGKALKA